MINNFKIFLFVFLCTLNQNILSKMTRNPNSEVSNISTISVEVVKPILINLKSNIYHSTFKGVAKIINGLFFLEVEASMNTTLLFKYEKEINLVSGVNTIPLKTEPVLDSILSEEVDNQHLIQVITPEAYTKKIWSIPYSIEVNGSESEGRYSGTLRVEVKYY